MRGGGFFSSCDPQSYPDPKSQKRILYTYGGEREKRRKNYNTREQDNETLGSTTTFPKRKDAHAQ